MCNLHSANLKNAQLEGANLENAEMFGAVLEKAGPWVANLKNAKLNRANLRNANMSMSNLSGAHLDKADLRGAILSDANMANAKLEGASLKYANLSGAKLQGARLREADLQEAFLQLANLRQCDLYRAKFQGAELAGAILAEVFADQVEFGGRPSQATKNATDDVGNKSSELSPKYPVGKSEPKPKEKEFAKISEIAFDARDLHTRQLAGASLANSHLPAYVWQGMNDSLSNVSEASKKVDKLFIGLLAGCAYFGIVLGLLTHGSFIKLPIINTTIDQNFFFWAAPLGILMFFFYFQLSLQRLWERLAELPAIFEDGTPLEFKAAPWLPVGYVRAHFLLLREKDRPPFSRLQTLIIQLLVWWSAPATLFAIWFRYLHDSPVLMICIVQIAAALVVAGISLVFMHRAQRTLRLEYLEWLPENNRRTVRFNVAVLKNILLKYWCRVLLLAGLVTAMVWYSYYIFNHHTQSIFSPSLPSLLI